MNISHTKLAAVLPPDFKRLLHINCGEGEIVRRLAERHDAFFTGVTEIREHLSAARRKNIAKAEFFLEGHRSLFFHDNTFDVIVSSETVDDFREIHRVLVPSGRFIMPYGGEYYPEIASMRMKLCGFEKISDHGDVLIAHKGSL